MPNLTHGPIVGTTTENSTVIWMRADSHCQAEIRLAKNAQDLPDNYLANGLTTLEDAADYTGTVRLDGLQADETYHYTILIDGNPVLPGENFPSLTMRTLPSESNMPETFSFAFGSCFIPQDFGDDIFADLEKKIITQQSDGSGLRLFLMIGDNVYVDHYFNENYKDADLNANELRQLYREAYRDTWKYENFRRALTKIPSYMIFDDHEFWDNWGNVDYDKDEEDHYDKEHYKAAVQAYWEYQDRHNPDAETRHQGQSPTYYYSFTVGDIGFFVLDCRTERDIDAKPRIMLSDTQWQALFAWLSDNNDTCRVKFIVSSIPITFSALPPWLVDSAHEKLGDQWLGYPEERAKLFKYIQDQGIQGVHFLSGDIHLGQGVLMQSKNDPTAPVVYSYTASPLAQTFWLLGTKAPAVSSALAGGLIGLLLGAKARGALGAIVGLVLGAVSGELIRRIWDRLNPKEENEAGLLGTLLFRVIRSLVQKLRNKGVKGVASDEIIGEGIHYEGENIFPHVETLNYGVVHVRRTDTAVTVQFELYDEKGKLQACDEPHEVP